MMRYCPDEKMECHLTACGDGRCARATMQAEAEADFSDFDSSECVLAPLKEIQPAPSREEVWLRAWCATMIYPGNVMGGSLNMADMCLAEFDKRFGQAKEE